MKAIRSISGQGWLAAGAATLYFVLWLSAPETIAGVGESLLLSAGLGAMALLWFLAVLCARLRAHEGNEGTFSGLAMASGLLVVAFYALGSALRVGVGGQRGPTTGGGPARQSLREFPDEPPGSREYGPSQDDETRRPSCSREG